MFFTALLCVTALLVTLYFLKRHKSSVKRPPCDLGFPLVGTIPQAVLNKILNPHHTTCHGMERLNKTYGPVSKFTLGLQDFVVISSYSAMKEALVTMGDVFSGRPTNPFYHIGTKYKGIIMAEGRIWQEHRRFALRVLKDFGFGKTLSEEMIRKESESLVKHLALKEGQEIQFKGIAAKAVTNIISSLVFSEHLDYEDEEFKESLEHFSILLNQGGIGPFLVLFYPFLCKDWLLTRIPSVSRVVRSEHWVFDNVIKKIEIVKKSFSPDNEPRNYTEAYLKEQYERQNGKEVSGVDTFDDVQLASSVFDLYIAGTDTTSNVLSWAMLFAALNPDKQVKAQQEILGVLGSREASWKDRKSLPYVQAFIDEVLRLSTIVPHSVDHRVLQDTEFRGFLIKKDDIIFFNLYSLHIDPEIFKDPLQFNPERFIDENGEYKQSEFLIPFSIGRRACLGERLAQMEIFLFLTALIRHFKVTATEETLKDVEAVLAGTDGIIRAPNPHTLVFNKIC